MLGRNAWPGTVRPADGTAPRRRRPAGRRRAAPRRHGGAGDHRPGGRLRTPGPARAAAPATSGRARSGRSPRVGSRLRILITSDEAPDLVAEITPQAAAELGLVDGASVWTSVKATEVTLVPL